MCLEEVYLRQTAKFIVNNTQDYNHKFPISVSSKIIIPIGKHHLSTQRHIEWRRKYNNVTEKLNDMKDLLYYQCSILDYDCIVEASVEYHANGLSHYQNFYYGPAKLDSYSPIKYQQIFSYPISATALFDSKSNREIEIYFDNNGFIIKCLNLYSLSFQEICSINISNPKDNIISICSLGQGSFKHKVHLDVNWTHFSHHPLRIQFHNQQNFLNSLYTINRIKMKLTKQPSISNHTKKSIQLFKTIQPQQNLLQSINIDIENNHDTINFKKSMTENQRKQVKTSSIMKGSEIIQNTKASNILSSENNYTNSVKEEYTENFIQQFDVLFQDDQHEEEQLCLNNSFEQLQKYSKADEEVEKLLQINKKKQQKKVTNQEKQKLLSKIQSLQVLNRELTTVNEKLKNQVKLLKNYDKQFPKLSMSEYKAMSNSLKRYQIRLINQINNIKSIKSSINITDESITKIKQQIIPSGKKFYDQISQDYFPNIILN